MTADHPTDNAKPAEESPAVRQARTQEEQIAQGALLLHFQDRAIRLHADLLAAHAEIARLTERLTEEHHATPEPDAWDGRVT